MFYGAAYLEKAALLFFILPAASVPPRRRIAPPTASLADRPPVQRLTGSGPQGEIALAGDEHAVRGRSVRGRAPPAIRSALEMRRPRDSGATVPTASPPEAQRARLEDAGNVKPGSGPVLCVRSNTLIEGRLCAFSCAHIRMGLESQPASLFYRGNCALRSDMPNSRSDRRI
jgi:hypothetical protein